MKEKRIQWEGSEVVVEWNENGGRCKKLIQEKWDEKKRGGKISVEIGGEKMIRVKERERKEHKENDIEISLFIVRRRWKIQLEK